MRLAYQIQGQKVKDQGEQAINADTHPAAYLPMRTHRVPLVGVFLSHFRINLHQTGM